MERVPDEFEVVTDSVLAPVGEKNIGLQTGISSYRAELPRRCLEGWTERGLPVAKECNRNRRRTVVVVAIAIAIAIVVAVVFV